MLIKTIPVGPLGANCYVVADEYTGEAMVIDPGDEPDTVLEQLEGLNLLYIVLTHAHFDHVSAVPDLKASTGAKVLLHEDELYLYSNAKDMAAFWGYQMDPLPEPDELLKEGGVIALGALRFTVIHTPGHSPGGICLYGGGAIFTGDTLFAGSVGRTDLPGGDFNKLKNSFRRLMSLPDNTSVLSGHGPASTIGRERAENMFSEEFLD